MEIRKKVQLHNPQALFNLTRIVQEYLISKNKLFIIVLLPLDLIFSLSLLLSFTERLIAYRIVNQFLQYIKYDLSYVKEIFLMIVKKDYVSAELTQKIEEKEISGTVYRHIQKTIKFLWSFFILILLLPILPFLWLYDFLAPKVMIGALYYIVLFVDLHDSLIIFLFLIATFLVASSTVPFLFKVFVYVKYLFELKRRPFDEIKADAETFFIKLYQYRHKDIVDDDEEEEKVGGGLYYLFLKTVHGIKDKSISFFTKVIFSQSRPKTQVENVKEKLKNVKEKIVTKVEQRKPIRITRLIGPCIALLFTFAVASFLVFGNAQGKGILASLVLSVVDKKEAAIIWTNYSNTSIGFFQNLFTNRLIFLPDFFHTIGLGLDILLKYFFLLWHTFFPLYINFIVFYYRFLISLIGIKV